VNADLGWRSPRLALSAAVVAFFVVVPLLGPSDYLMNLLITGLIWAVLNQSWNLVLGVAGVWNFAQLALFAVGGYVSAIITIRTGVPAVPALIAGGLAAAAASVVIGIPSLRLRGIYASLLTFSFAEVIRLLVISDDSGLTGGTFGLAPVPGLGFESLSPDAAQRAYYWSALALCVVTAVVLYRVLHSPSGLAFQALRDSPGYAAARGISRLQFQLIAFGASAFIAGVAGGFYAQYFHVISPSVMGLGPMTLFVTMLVVGGLGTVSGPLVGTAVILAISEYLRDHNEYRLIVLGVILLAMIVVAPRGIVPVLADTRARLERWMSEDEEAGEPVRDTAVAEVGDTRARPPREQVGRKEEA
jgi:branched-chain amino acid transport system permease protein